MGVLQDLGDPDPPMNAFSIAGALGVKVVAASIRRAQLAGNTILVCASAQGAYQHGLIAHELGHWALIKAGDADPENAASYVGAALMLPQRHFSADLRSTGWDVRALRAKHVNCSAEMIARRIVALRDAVVAIWDQGKLTIRVPSPWLSEGYRKISKFERELAAEVLASGETINAGNLLWGFAVFEGDYKRVITVCEAEQLGFRY